MAAEPIRQPAPTVGRGLGVAVGLCAAPCAFGVYYGSPYTFPYLPVEVWGLAGLTASVILGLVAARLARWPRLGPAAVGLLAGVAPGVYMGLEAITLVPSNAAAAAMTMGSLACVIIGSAVGLGAGIMTQREWRWTAWLGCAAATHYADAWDLAATPVLGPTSVTAAITVSGHRSRARPPPATVRHILPNIWPHYVTLTRPLSSPPTRSLKVIRQHALEGPNCMKT
jgi:hypothetical protein